VAPAFSRLMVVQLPPATAKSFAALPVIFVERLSDPAGSLLVTFRDALCGCPATASPKASVPAGLVVRYKKLGAHPGVAVPVGLGVIVGVAVGVAVEVGVAVIEAVAVGVTVDVAVGVAVPVVVAVGVMLAVDVAVDVVVAVVVAVEVAVGDGVAVGLGLPLNSPKLTVNVSG